MESCLWRICCITCCCCIISSCFISSLGFFDSWDTLFGSWMKDPGTCAPIWREDGPVWDAGNDVALEAPFSCCWFCCNCWAFWSWWVLCCTTQEPSITDEPEILILFDVNDMGDAGNRKYESVLTLALLCKWGPPERAEFASVTKELAPTLGAEFATLFKAALFISPETGPKFVRRAPVTVLDELTIDELKWVLTTLCDCLSPWKKIPECEDDWVNPPVTREGVMGVIPPWWLQSV